MYSTITQANVLILESVNFIFFFYIHYIRINIYQNLVLSECRSYLKKKKLIE